MSLDAEFQERRRTESVQGHADAAAVTARARACNPLAPSPSVPLDTETIRAALSVLPTAVADGEE